MSLYVSGSDLRKKRRRAKRKEKERLLNLEAELQEEADFLTTEGQGIGRMADIDLFGDEPDEEEELLRSTGQLQTGLLL